jgi:hypothetical protein
VAGPVGRSLRFHAGYVLPARDVAGYELSEQAQPLRLRAALQQNAPEVEIVDAIGQAEAEIAAGALDGQSRFFLPDFMP